MISAPIFLHGSNGVSCREDAEFWPYLASTPSSCWRRVCSRWSLVCTVLLLFKVDVDARFGFAHECFIHVFSTLTATLFTRAIPQLCGFWSL